MTRRIVAITVAIVLAALGAAGGLFLILTADQRAQDRLQDAVTVAVAKSSMSIGTSGAKARLDELVKLIRLPRANVPADALTDWGASYDKLVLTSNVAASQVLLKGNFGEPTKITSGLPLPDGKIALTIQAGGPQAVGGLIKPGTDVVVFITYTPSTNGTRNALTTGVLLPRIQILAVNASLVTVAVTKEEAEALILGASRGALYLGLLTDSVNLKPDVILDNTG